MGFDTSGWRTSLDGTRALCHDKFAQTLVGNVEGDTRINIYDIDNIEFKNIINDEFTELEPDLEQQEGVTL